MRHGDKKQLKELEVGDIVRLINGPNPLGGGTIGGPDDYREGYDTCTVVEVTEQNVTFERPYLNVYKDGSRNAGVEKFSAPRSHTGLWYERINNVGRRMG